MKRIFIVSALSLLFFPELWVFPELSALLFKRPDEPSGAGECLDGKTGFRQPVFQRQRLCF